MPSIFKFSFNVLASLTRSVFIWVICFLNFGFGCPVQTQKIHSQPVSDGRGLTNGRSLRLHATCLIDSRNEAEAPRTSRQVREFPPAAATLWWINSRGNSSPHRYVYSLTLATVIWSGLICHVCKSTLCIKYSSVEPYLSHFLNSVPRNCSVPAWRLITEVYYGRGKWCVMGLTTCCACDYFGINWVASNTDVSPLTGH